MYKNLKLHVFDLDHTLLNGNCSFRFGFYLYKEKFFSLSKSIIALIHYFRHKYLGMSLEKLHQKIFDVIFKDQSLEVVQRHVENFLHKNFLAMLNLGVVKYMREAQANGDFVYILSSSPDFLVKPIASRLGVLLAVGTTYQIDSKNSFTALDCVLSGQQKANFVQNLMFQNCLGPSSLVVYSDSYHDLPLLNLAGEVVVVRPDSQLKRISKKNGWKILF